MKKIIVIIFSLFLVTSCGSTSSDSTSSGATTEKTPFLVKTQKLSDFSGSTSIEKSGRITASSSLTLTSKWAWEISKILVQEGQYIRAWSTVAIMRDTVNNFDLRLDQAENALLQQNASIASTEANMNSSIDAARIALARARLAYENANSRKNIQSLTLSTTNQRTVESYNILYKNYLSDLERQMTQMLYSGDKILGISPAFENANNSWEAYLGAYVGNTKSDAQNQWNNVYALRWDIRSRQEKWFYITPTNAYTDLKYISDAYDQLQKYADVMIYMIQNSTNGGSLSQELQAGWIAEWNGIRAQIQGSLASYGGWKAQVLAFLKTYEATEKATDLAIASLSRTLTPAEKALIEWSNDMRVTYETSRITLRDSIENARLGVEQSESAYNNALTVKNATLTQMRVMRANAEIALAQAKRDYAKLAITAPVEGTITKLRTSVGETINPGSPIAEFAGKKTEVIIDIDPELAKTLGVGDSVDVLIGEENLIGKITAVSTLAGANLLSTVRIAVADGEKYIGQSVIIRFQNLGTIDSKKVLLPIDAIKILSEGEGEISVLTPETTIIKKTVEIKNIGGTNVEVTWDLSPGDMVIITDLSNFDGEKNTIKLQ
jgi:multidrug efflux pump subunit AcrA (membrane-fusion protein)